MLAVWVIEERHCPPPLHHPGSVSSRIRLLVLPGDPVCPSCLSIPTLRQDLELLKTLRCSALLGTGLPPGLVPAPPACRGAGCWPLSECLQLSTTFGHGSPCLSELTVTVDTLLALLLCLALQSWSIIIRAHGLVGSRPDTQQLLLWSAP